MKDPCRTCEDQEACEVPSDCPALQTYRRWTAAKRRGDFEEMNEAEWDEWELAS